MTPDEPAGPVPAERDGDEYDRSRRRVLWSLPSGLYVVGSRSGDRRNLMTCSWVMQVATSPKLVAVAIERASVTLGLIEASGFFTVSVLRRQDRAVVRRFVKPADDVVLDEGRAVAIQGVPVVEAGGGVPRLAEAAAWLACGVRPATAGERGEGIDDGSPSHRLVVGEVLDVGGPVAEDATGGGRPEVLRMEDTRMNYGG